MSDGETVELFADDFTKYPLCYRIESPASTGDQWTDVPLGCEGIGEWTQPSLHYMWNSPRTGNWMQCRLPWRVVDRDGRRFLEQPESFFNVVLKTGSDLWRDYAMELDVAVCGGPGGPVVRYHTSRRNYWVRFQVGRPVELVRRDQNDHIVLGASSGLAVEADRVYRCRVSCQGSRIEVSLDGKAVIDIADDAYAQGGVALRTEGPCRFAAVGVLATQAEADRIAAAKAGAGSRAAARKKRYPQPRLLHSVKVPASAKWVHVQDINDDGSPEVLACELSVPELDYIRLTGMAALDLQGRVLWQFGQTVEGGHAVHGGFAFNAGDIDGDGRTEILVTRDFEILVLDGATGEVKRRCPTPASYKGREDYYPQTVGDSFLVCNLRGLATPQDFILKDRYCNLWAYTGDLAPLWHRALNTGHYPRAADINGDGRDEIMAGYAMLDCEGNTLWAVPGGDAIRNRFPGPEHMDSVILNRFGPGPDAPMQIAMAASDLGFILMDTQGKVLAQHYVGHAQALGCGRFRSDLPGRQFVVATAWGNFFILNLFDCRGQLLLTREVPRCSVIPVNWLGDGSALLRFEQVLADGNFEPVVDLPRGGEVFPVAWDVNGDGVDELLVRRGDTVEIYGPDRLPPKPFAQTPRTLTNWNVYGGFYL